MVYNPRERKVRIFVSCSKREVKSFNFASTIIKVERKTKILRYQSVVILSFSLNHFVQSVRRFWEMRMCNMERWIRIYRILYSTVYNRKEWRKERCVNIFFASCLKKKKVESINFVSTIDNVERTPRYQSVVILSLSLTINFNLADFTTRRNGRHANFIWESRAVPFETACSRAGSLQSGLTDRFNSQGS